jgi:parallel beta-helix repeat protein
VSGVTSSNLTVAASRNMTVRDNEIICGDGIQFAFVSDSLVTGNQVHRTGPTAAEDGICLYRSDRNTISGNRAWNNRRAGIRLWLSSGNHLTGNELTANDTGLTLAASDDNEVSGNTVMSNPTGIELVAGSTGNVVEKNVLYDRDGKYAKYGLSVQQSVNNRIESNAIVGVEIGIELADQGNNNAVLANTIVGASGYGLLVTGSYNEIGGNLIAQKSQGILFPETLGKSKPAGNRIHDNVFTDNGRHLYLSNDTEANRLYKNAFFGAASKLVIDRGVNVWADSGSGNYWEDYAGADSNGDGIGDVPVLVVPSGSQDTAPLVSRSIALAGLGVLTRLEKAELKLRAANGQELQVSALVADDVYSRFVGFRGFPASLFPGFPGILFVFEQDVDSRFTMETALVPLDIAFFDSTGAYVGGATMEAGSTELYTASAPFSYALELQSGTLTAEGIGAGSLLVLPPGR